MRKVCIVIQSLVSRRPTSPFGLQLGSRETPHASHHETEEERCLRRNQRRAARAVWVRCELSTPRRDPKTGGLACSSRRRAQPFLSSYCPQRGQSGMSARPALKFKPRRGNAFRTSRQGERELGVVQEARSWRPIPVRADLLCRPSRAAR